MEPIQGEGGVLIPPAGYLKGLRKLADDNHCLLVLDEIQSGFGRTGKMFAFEHEGIRPDGITVGKALSGGFYPVSAFLSSKEVMDVFTPGIHGSTYGGNPLACAVATAELGLHFKARLEGIKSKKVKAIRCRGLWAGIDLTDDAGPAKSYCYALKERGMLCKDTHVRTIRLAPPLVITKEQIDWAVDQLEAVLA
jgi:ornithine--oxo-acid transaminase